MVMVSMSEYPPMEILERLLTEIAPAIDGLMPDHVLARAAMTKHPAALSPCCSVDHVLLPKTSFVMRRKSMTRCPYMIVIGMRTAKGEDPALVKRSPSPHGWPRLRSGRPRPIRLHRWICATVYGAASGDKCEATHLCGNSACIAAAHLRWQSRRDNMLDQTFHLDHPPRQTRAGMRRFARQSWSK